MDGSLLGPSLVGGFRTGGDTPVPFAGASGFDAIRKSALGPLSSAVCPVTASGTRPPTLPIVERPATYLCPGETHPISRAVHLARLAAFYPKCRTCEHRRDSGQIAHSTTDRLELTSQRRRPGPCFARRMCAACTSINSHVMSSDRWALPSPVCCGSPARCRAHRHALPPREGPGLS